MPSAADIARALRAEIVSRHLPPGAPIQSSAELMERFGVSRQTVQTAMNQLRREGLIDSRPGRGHGWFVRERPTVIRVSSTRLGRAARQANLGAFLGDARAGGWEARPVTRVNFTTANEELAAALEVPPGTELTVRDRVMSADDVVVQLATSYLPRDLTRGTVMEDENPGPGGIYARLEDAGHQLRSFTEAVTAAPADEVQATGLGVPVGAVVLHVERIAYAERPVELNRMVMLAERYTLIYDIPAD